MKQIQILTEKLIIQNFFNGINRYKRALKKDHFLSFMEKFALIIFDVFVFIN